MKKVGIAVIVAIGASIFFPMVGIAQESKEEKDPLLYGLASFVLPGLGQYLNNEPNKTLSHFLIAVAIPVVCPLLFSNYPYILSSSLCALLQLGWHAYSAIDAYETAKIRSSSTK
jgi:hypothetical protein